MAEAERVPVRSLLKGELRNVRLQLASLAQRLRSGTSGKKDAPQATEMEAAFGDALAAAGKLRGAVQVLREHQQFQTKLIGLQRQISAKDAEILKLSEVLREAQAGVEQVVFQEAKPLLGKAVGTEPLRPVDAATVLKLAERLSFATAAPPGWHFAQGMEIPFPYKPPAPQEDVIRSGHLFTKVERIVKDLAAALKVPAEGEAKKAEEKDGDAASSANDQKPEVDGQDGGSGPAAATAAAAAASAPAAAGTAGSTAAEAADGNASKAKEEAEAAAPAADKAAGSEPAGADDSAPPPAKKLKKEPSDGGDGGDSDDEFDI